MSDENKVSVETETEKKEKELQNRLKSPVFWAAIVAQGLTILVITGVIGSDTSTTINNAIAAALQVFVAFGVLNDPTHKGGI